MLNVCFFSIFCSIFFLYDLLVTKIVFSLPSREINERIKSMFCFRVDGLPFFFLFLFIISWNVKFLFCCMVCQPGRSEFRVVWPNVMRILSTPTDGHLSNLTLPPVTQLLYPSLGGRRNEREQGGRGSTVAEAWLPPIVRQIIQFSLSISLINCCLL